MVFQLVPEGWVQPLTRQRTREKFPGKRLCAWAPGREDIDQLEGLFRVSGGRWGQRCRQEPDQGSLAWSYKASERDPEDKGKMLVVWLKIFFLVFFFFIFTEFTGGTLVSKII